MRQTKERTHENIVSLINPAGLYDPAPNGYSHVARACCAFIAFVALAAATAL